ncbi:Na+/H+ antiporter NhaC [Niameybacter massiliensis]|uniref:Na+/H+ antiporter NhaC n=1 Tax=Niameybacter massiliensis TaxID=1658108 RepID=UPI0006B50C63|nr:Na+/H+ antiporter NhaC [Niameybacter massiliensis]
MQETTNKVSFHFAVITLLSIIGILTTGILWLKLDIVVVVFITLLFSWGAAYLAGYKWKTLVEWMATSTGKVAEGLIIFLLIGTLIGSWITSGTVPAIIYYGLQIINPDIILPAGFVVCCLTSFIMGTSWGTVATVGVAVFSMCVGMDMGIPEPLIAGMIVSGAWFGDKMSPISDTAVIATAATGSDLYDHIKTMSYTTVPAFFIALIMYGVIGLKYSGGVGNQEGIEQLMQGLDSVFHISIWALLPMIILLIMSIKKVPAVLALTISSLVAVIVAILIQKTPINEALMCLYAGYTTPTGNEIVDTLLMRGGISSMMWSFTLGFLALNLGGVLEGLGVLNVLINRLIQPIKRDATLITTTIGTGIMSNAIMGDMYLPVILSGSLYKEAYDQRNMKRSMLSRVIVEGVALCNPLIPWTAAAAFVSNTLGVATLDYLPYAFFNLVNPLLTILLAYMGIFIFRNKVDNE